AAGSVSKKLALRSGIGVRYGCHCAHIIVKQVVGFTPVTEAIQRFVVTIVPPLILQGFTRISFGLQNTAAEVDVFLNSLSKIAKKEKPDTSNTKSENGNVKKEELKQAKSKVEDYIESRSQVVYG
ncbi:MAG: hypothetical protein KDC05_03950, partial [Bacteroidales bacterium]|nr:hypothetical protein [Bacteroidales bacterium]